MNINYGRDELYKRLRQQAEERRLKAIEEQRANEGGDEAMYDAEAGMRLAALGKGLSSAANKFSGCLLYTSPSPRDRQKSRMPSSA